ncbi:MAG: hypothetical protein ISR83_03685 [Candidatus Marinimicrobia bacterium]|nr:hypothetical protein [Candidatus Neomarinimicrobiota bacterium]
MKNNKCLTFIFFLTTLIMGQPIPQGDILSETPLYPVPADMTFEEYQDMNRRLTIGLALSSVPIPGIIHQYAGEEKTAKKLRMIGIGGLVSILTGSAMLKEKGWKESSYDIMILNEDQENEKRFEKIPVNQFGDDIGYKLVPLGKESEGSGGGLILLGAVVLACDVLYDWFHGWKTIVHKRDAVRFKYGQQLQVSVLPEIDFLSQSAGLEFSLNF